MHPENVHSKQLNKKNLKSRRGEKFPVLQEFPLLIIPCSITLASVILQVKLPTLVYLASLSLASPLNAARQANSSIPAVVDQIQRPELSKALERALQESFATDDEIAVYQTQEKEPHFRIEVTLQHDVRFPDREAMFCHFTSPNGDERYLTLLYFPAQLNQRGLSWVAKLGAESILRQLKAEAVVNLAPRLDQDMSKNIVTLDTARRELQVETLGKASDWTEIQKDLASKKLPIAARAQDLDSPELLSYHEAPPANIIDPLNPPPKEKPYERLPIQPFKAQVASELERQLTFPYPRFETAGPMALLLNPSLGSIDSDPRYYGTVGTAVTVTAQDMSGRGPFNSFNKLTWDGPLYREYFSVSTRLWERLGIGLESGFGQQDAKIELEIDHPTAPGGTTFLPSGTVGGGLLDTKLFINGLFETPTMIFRPLLVIKMPTGDQENLLGSGHADFSIGASLEGYWYNWHTKGMLSYTRPGELNIFDAHQAPIETTPYVYGALGMGRELNIFGGERVSMSLNAMENPMRRATNIDALDVALVSFNVLAEKNFTRSFCLRVEASYGLTDSAANNTVGMSAFLRF